MSCTLNIPRDNDGCHTKETALRPRCKRREKEAKSDDAKSVKKAKKDETRTRKSGEKRGKKRVRKYSSSPFLLGSFSHE
jgi:hypothetical protein